MKTIKKIITVLLTITVIGSAAQSSKEKIEHVQISGNCDLCKKAIEKAGYKKGVVKIDWNSDNKIATITYDSSKQTDDVILKRIAYAGYDNAKFLAPDEAYEKLPQCCKYERILKESKQKQTEVIANKNEDKLQTSELITLETLFSNYFELKNAFIQSAVKNISTQALELSKHLKSLDTTELNEDQHQLVVKLEEGMINTCNDISKSDKIDMQRTRFNELSHDFYQLAKVAGLHYESYWQHCPMFNDGSDWLSKEPQIKNPYYGNQMLTCGKTTETIK